jgi:uncharacterized RmlC-like cupin family protein
MDKIQKVSGKQVERDSKTNIARRSIFDTETDHVDEIRLAAGLVGGWHHHARRTMYGYVVSGKASMEFGKKGMERVDLSQGDFFMIPPSLVHRDVNPNKEDAIILIFNIGQGPTTQEVSGPEV